MRKPDTETAGEIGASLDTLGQRIYDIRVLRGMSQGDIVKIASGALSTAGISRIETGSRRDPAASTLLAVCMALDIDIKLTRRGQIEIHGTGLAGAFRKGPNT